MRRFQLDCRLASSVSNQIIFQIEILGSDGTRIRTLLRDRQTLYLLSILRLRNGYE
jgi:hypothetical protein